MIPWFHKINIINWSLLSRKQTPEICYNYIVTLKTWKYIFSTKKSMKQKLWLVEQFFFNLNIFLLLLNYNCLHFLPTPPPYPSQTHLPPLPPPCPLALSMCPLQQFLKTPLPTVLSPLPSCYYQITLNFNDSGYILFACLFC